MVSQHSLLRRLTLSKTARDRLSKVLAGVLTAIIVACVVVILCMHKNGPNTPPSPPTTRFSTTTTPRPPVIYKNCDEAHADGRWDIPQGDPAYRPGLDKDHNGIACESRKPQ